MRGIITRIMIFVMVFTLGIIPANAGEEGATETETEVNFLDAEALDAFFDFSGGYEGLTLAIPEITGLDAALDALGEPIPFDFELGFTLANAYIWRGQTLGGDVSFQPYITVSPSFEPLGDLSFTFWADITRDEPGENQREYDFVVDYNVDIPDVLGLVGYSEEDTPYAVSKLLDFNFNTGYIYYKFPPQPDTKSQEVYFGVTYDLPLHPSFYVYNDWDRGRGAWLEWGISQDVNVGLFTLATYANVGYNKGQWGADSQFSTCDFGASIPIALGTHMSIEPFISYTKELDDDGADMVNDEIYGGVNYSISF